MKRVGSFKGRLVPYKIEHFSEANELLESLKFSSQMKLKNLEIRDSSDPAEFVNACDPGNLLFVKEGDQTYLTLDDHRHIVWVLQQTRVDNFTLKEHLLMGPKILRTSRGLSVSYKADQRYGPKQIYRTQLSFGPSGTVVGVKVRYESPVGPSFSLECGVR